MNSILVVGAGKIGVVIADLLSETRDYRVTLVDRNQQALDLALTELPHIRVAQADALDGAEIRSLMKGQRAVINACPFDISMPLARAACAEKIHYLDLTEDVASARAIRSLAADAQSASIPQCGLAPGFISIVANDLARKFDTLHNVHMRVGALPVYPTNALKYNLTWSTDGLINEYLNPCEAIVKGERRQVPPLEELEHFSMDGIDYEAFNTSGGLGTLCETLAGKVTNLNYRTVRYPGHRDLMKMLIDDLRLGERPKLLKEILETAVPITMQDVVLVFASVSGSKHGHFVQETFARKIYSKQIHGRLRSAIQITTASSICAVLDLLLQGKLPTKGFIRQEEIQFDDFVANRFGCHYLQREIAETTVAPCRGLGSGGFEPYSAYQA